MPAPLIDVKRIRHRSSHERYADTGSKTVCGRHDRVLSGEWRRKLPHQSGRARHQTAGHRGGSRGSKPVPDRLVSKCRLHRRACSRTIGYRNQRVLSRLKMNCSISVETQKCKSSGAVTGPRTEIRVGIVAS